TLPTLITTVYTKHITYLYTYNDVKMDIDTDEIDYSAMEARNEIQGQTHTRQEND
ncbi:13448_t:CDS:2, partial [Racocetra fulgida]